MLYPEVSSSLVIWLYWWKINTKFTAKTSSSRNVNAMLFLRQDRIIWKLLIKTYLESILRIVIGKTVMNDKYVQCITRLTYFGGESYNYDIKKYFEKNCLVSYLYRRNFEFGEDCGQFFCQYLSPYSFLSFSENFSELFSSAEFFTVTVIALHSTLSNSLPVSYCFSVLAESFTTPTYHHLHLIPYFLLSLLPSVTSWLK